MWQSIDEAEQEEEEGSDFDEEDRSEGLEDGEAGEWHLCHALPLDIQDNDSCCRKSEATCLGR